MSTNDTFKDAAAVDAAIRGMADDLRALFAARGIQNPLMIGIHTGGVWVAQRLHALLELSDPLGHLDISFYRDDFTRIGLHPQVRPSHLPEAVDDRHICLVDDVLQSGRTIRAALNVLFDYGRPASVMLAILAERDGRELPIEPDVVGLEVRLGPGEQIKLSGPEPLQLLHGQIPHERSHDRRRAGDQTGDAAGDEAGDNAGA
ncbi:bifunctional pyr operon transcriptional regulator/uracil phosphoribosyltransferase PyrR [Thiohalocapsa marina]|uniref:Bifunctional pyr operon transcriptional regulator/uracil phosphoribosyltransferase PyrR n=1 Tax=Thiohalocapsa marina TaxID=424902 RepID=A0A5M8FKZ1_9GAMM|nr:bifunctional pyr operon transcriptional regulator/uracil phosphoribosyltransferase PyrR [Thiohalocapsa marina]KAA6185377.1 bifunctional pyr operon transcriptional regulator/uracil phosphoribosyltransferase PyrR [Thiohalocapsa marina]